ncbi:MAG TPA: hypothetical protein PLN11_00090 [Ottowia sp.]|nr:hypothetical protein [Ottowia sp.]
MVLAAAQGFNQVQAGRWSKAQADANAAQADYQAQLEQDNALKSAELIRRAGRNQVGQTVAAYAGAGAKVGEGSALEAERQVNQDVEHDAFQAILEGGRRARGLRTQAELTRIDGHMKQTAANVSAVGTVMGGAYGALRASGWRTAGPGFSGTQAPAPVEDRSIRPNTYAESNWRGGRDY